MSSKVSFFFFECVKIPLCLLHLILLLRFLAEEKKAISSNVSIYWWHPLSNFPLQSTWPLTHNTDLPAIFGRNQTVAVQNHHVYKPRNTPEYMVAELESKMT